VAPPIRNVSELLNVKNLLLAIQNITGANPIVGTIKPPEAGSTWLECLPEGWTARIHEDYLRCVFAILSPRNKERPSPAGWSISAQLANKLPSHEQPPQPARKHGPRSHIPCYCQLQPRNQDGTRSNARRCHFPQCHRFSHPLSHQGIHTTRMLGMSWHPGSPRTPPSSFQRLPSQDSRRCEVNFLLPPPGIQGLHAPTAPVR
jgi:hypothetical protein